MTDAEFEAGGLAARQPSHLADERHHFQRRRNAGASPAKCSPSSPDAPDLGDFFGHLGRRQHAAMAGLGALADLELDHLDLVGGSDPLELFRIERSVAVAATEISGADLPDQIAAVFAVIRADTALTGVMCEAALFGARVQRAHRVGTERAKTHRRDIED